MKLREIIDRLRNPDLSKPVETIEVMQHAADMLELMRDGYTQLMNARQVAREALIDAMADAEKGTKQ